MLAAEAAQDLSRASARDLIFSPFADCPHLALGVSGGSDSMALLRLAVDWRARECPTLPLTILTVDHGLRPESAGEARQVKAWCAALGVPHVTLRWDGAPPATGLQAKARAARYALLTGWCAAHRVDDLLTAHTLDDQAETIAMRQLRSLSVRSLGGIRRMNVWQNGVRVHRPLLDTRRAALRDVLRRLGQAWLEDPSNENPCFERVRVRQHLAAVSGEVQRLVRLGQSAARQRDAVEAEALAWCQAHLASYPQGFGVVPRAAMAALPAAVCDDALLRLIALFGGGVAPAPAAVARLRQALLFPRPTRITLGGALVAVRSRDIVFGREWRRIKAVAIDEATPQPVAWDGRFTITALAGALILAAGAVSGLAREKDLPRFVQDGLPALREPGGKLLLFPQLQAQGRVKFMRHLR